MTNGEENGNGNGRGKDLAIAGLGGLLIYAVFKSANGGLSGLFKGGIIRHSVCDVFVKTDGTLRLNGKDATLPEVKRKCKSVILRSSGAATSGRVNAIAADLRASGIKVSTATR